MCSVTNLCVASLFVYLAVMAKTGDKRPAKVQTNLKELFKKPRSSVLQNPLGTSSSSVGNVSSSEGDLSSPRNDDGGKEVTTSEEDLLSSENVVGRTDGDSSLIFVSLQQCFA